MESSYDVNMAVAARCTAFMCLARAACSCRYTSAASTCVAADPGSAAGTSDITPSGQPGGANSVVLPALRVLRSVRSSGMGSLAERGPMATHASARLAAGLDPRARAPERASFGMWT